MVIWGLSLGVVLSRLVCFLLFLLLSLVNLRHQINLTLLIYSTGDQSVHEVDLRCHIVYTCIVLVGGSPYPGVEINEKFIGLLQDGYRMEKPRFASDEMLVCRQAFV